MIYVCKSRAESSLHVIRTRQASLDPFPRHSTELLEIFRRYVIHTQHKNAISMRPLSSYLWAPQLSGYICKGCTRQLHRQKRRYATSQPQQELYDVVCVGGGPAGLSLLAALRTIVLLSEEPKTKLIDNPEQVRTQLLPISK